jgi:polyferredoxin
MNEVALDAWMLLFWLGGFGVASITMLVSPVWCKTDCLDRELLNMH